MAVITGEMPMLMRLYFGTGLSTAVIYKNKNYTVFDSETVNEFDRLAWAFTARLTR